MAEPHDLTALEQADAIRRGELSSVELVEHHLRRVDALGDTVGAFVTVTPSRRGRRPGPPTRCRWTSGGRCTAYRPPSRI